MIKAIALCLLASFSMARGAEEQHKIIKVFVAQKNDTGTFDPTATYDIDITKKTTLAEILVLINEKHHTPVNRENYHIPFIGYTGELSFTAAEFFERTNSNGFYFFPKGN